MAATPEAVWQVYMPPHLFFDIENRLNGLRGDTASVFTIEQINGVERKRLYGIFAINETNTLGVNMVGGKEHYPIMITTPRATTFGTRLATAQEQTPDTNPFGAYYKYDQYMEYYGEVIDPRFLYRLDVRAEA